MRYRIVDNAYRFFSVFDTETGAYFRSGILDKHGRDTGKDPFMASFPHLIDVGVMGHCIHGKTKRCLLAGVECYQSGSVISKPNMRLEDFEWIASQCKQKCNQLALGGRGDPDQHEHFEDLLAICRDNRLVPNFTTSGFGITREHARLCGEYCGAVAVSWYRSSYTYDAINTLLAADVKTNIHYVLGNNSIDEAIDRLRHDSFPKGINAVIFLLHKPVGLGSKENVLKLHDPRVTEFFRLVDEQHPYKVGMDSCTVPGALNMCANVLPESLDTCEGGRFSCYIASNMTMVPCSFDQTGQYQVQLSGPDREVGLPSIQDAWMSEPFEAFRNSMRRSCPTCSKRELCMGGCPLMPDIVLCQLPEKQHA